MGLGLGGTSGTATKSAIGLGNILPSGLTSLLGSAGMRNNSNSKYVVLKTVMDLFFQDWCVWMQNAEIIWTTQNTSSGGGVGLSSSGVPLPLIGFTFLPPQNLEILKYTYSEYPFVNRAVIANNMQKEPTQITLQALRPITAGNSIMVNFAANWLGIKYYIEKYCDFGGLWTIVTQWGIRTNYLLTDLKGTMPVGSQAGVGFEFTFKRYNFDDQETSMYKNNALTSILGKA